MTFTGFVCWKHESLDLIETVAEDASRAMFLATHQPVRALQTQVGRGGDGHPANEVDVLRILESKRSDPLIIPIIGQSGSGKSHLVRWLQLHMKPTKSRHVIYVPRERTSLADVVSLILESVPEEHGDAELEHEVEELQANLKRASREIPEMELRRRLVENIAHCVLRLDPLKSPYDASREAEGWRFLVGENGLAVLLGDPLYKNALSADGGVIARLAARITHGRGGDTSGEDPLFAFDDLVIDLPNVALMNKLARDAYDRFRRPTQRWLADIACDVLNHTLEEVAQETMGLSDNLGRPRVSTIMLAVRRVLARRKMELVLLVEDLAVLHGIQRQLLEALITPRRRESGDGEAGDDLCQIRAAIAVTTGVWRQLEQSIDTLSRRLESWDTPLINLDIPIEAESASAAYGRGFTAAYLNAVRLGREGLDSALADFEKQTSAKEYRAPTACATCPYRSECHEAFGEADGRGFYPFNEEAIGRMVDVEARRSNGRFDPRRVVQSIRKMLDLAGHELPEGTFPGADVREYFVDAETAMSAPLSARLTRADAATGKRRRTLLELWGQKPYGVRNLDPRIHRAFDLQALPEELLVGGDEVEDEEEEKDNEVTRLDSATQRVFTELEKWGRGEATLGDNFARTLREWVFDAVLAQVDFETLSQGRSDDLLLEIGVPDGSRCVSIDGSRGDTRSGGAGAVVFHVERSESSVRLFRGLVQLNLHKSWTFRDGEDAMLAVAEVTTPWADVVEARLRSRGDDATSGEIDSQYIAGMLAVTGRILGLEKPADVPGSSATVLSLALTAAGPEARETADWSEKWKRLRGLSTTPPRGREIRGTAQQSLLQRLGRTQGRGESIVAIDAAEVMDELERVAVDWMPPSPGQDSPAEHLRWYEGVAGTS